eukprot:TRINITY_DN27168_c0_g1_i1.p1 TRINITY_DN27168_c0_g1~~TRINITY_DN27168_c0_g1_i1.p1  ORF type:complete len:389 (+),score=24.51 TRINITY_DN27168_c0_g1_i1:391-1557(+)
MEMEYATSGRLTVTSNDTNTEETKRSSSFPDLLALKVGSANSNAKESFNNSTHGNDDVPKERPLLQQALDNLMILSYLVIFSIFGVLIRYGLQLLCGEQNLKITSYNSALHIALPPNMVGCYFMGWVGIAFKHSLPNQYIATGLSTGLMGSITTFSLWIHEMVHLTMKGHWVRGNIGLLIGMELPYMSMLVGRDTANFLKYAMSCLGKKKDKSKDLPLSTNEKQLKHPSVLPIIGSIILWGGFLMLYIFDINSKNRTILWIACVVSPFGTWLRWLLARLNNGGPHNSMCLQWMPFGTLFANLIATNMLQLLYLLGIKVCNEKASLWIKGINLGFVGCLSTVSTMIIEIYTMREKGQLWKGYAYILISVFSNFISSTSIYLLSRKVKGI